MSTDDSPLVSVMTTCYNNRDLLGLALASLLCQTYENWECVVVDDGSKDRPEEVVEAAGDSRIRLIKLEKNQGRGPARQRALVESKGKYICVLDADDWCYPDKIETQVRLLGEHPQCCLVSTSMAVADASFKLIGVRRAGSGVTGPQPAFRALEMPCIWGTSMLEAKSARETGFDTNLRGSEDWDFLVRFTRGRSFLKFPEPTYVYHEFTGTDFKTVMWKAKNNNRMFSKYKKSHPLASRLMIAKRTIKTQVYRAVFAAGIDRAVINLRQMSPASEEETARFQRFQKKVFEAARNRFEWRPPQAE